MAKTKRRDKSRVVLRTGESQRADGTYHYSWTDANRKRRYVYVSRDEDKLGSLECGKQANFVVVSDDVFEVAEDHIKDIKVLETYVDGECKYKCE